MSYSRVYEIQRLDEAARYTIHSGAYLFFLRKMELQISKYQDLLRKKIYQSEIKIYHEIGEARFEEFYAYYEEEFQKVSFIILN